MPHRSRGVQRLAPGCHRSVADGTGCQRDRHGLKLLKTLPQTDVIVTGDAMFAQRDICRVITERGGDYFFMVKDNQPALNADIALAFGPDSPLCRIVAAA